MKYVEKCYLKIQWYRTMKSKHKQFIHEKYTKIKIHIIMILWNDYKSEWQNSPNDIE